MLTLVLILACVALGLFLLSLIVYFFNLDMKGAAVMQKLIRKRYDRLKRDRRL